MLGAGVPAPGAGPEPGVPWGQGRGARAGIQHRYNHLGAYYHNDENYNIYIDDSDDDIKFVMVILW